MLVFAILVGLLATSKAWILKASHNTVEIGKTKNVMLVCQYGTTSSADRLVSLERIRIYRLDDEGKKLTLAKIGVSDTIKDSMEMHVRGYFQDGTNKNESYLNITWPVATENTPGKYGCQIGWLDKDRKFAQREVPTVTIQRQSLTLQDLLKMIEDSKKDFEETRDSLEMEIKKLKKELADARKDNENARQEIESTKQSIKKLRNETYEGDLILIEELTKHREFITVFQIDILELRNITKNLNTDLRDTISDFRKDLSNRQVNLTCTAKCQQEILKLRREREESDATIEKRIVKLENQTIGEVKKQIETLELQVEREISVISNQADERHESLQEEILRVQNVTIHQLTLQIRENEENCRKELSDIKEEHMELEKKLQKQFLNLTNSTQQNTLEQNQEVGRVLQEIFFKLKNLTASEEERQGRENYTKLQEDVSYLERMTDELFNKLQNEMSLREREHKNTKAKIGKGLSDLKNFTVQEILNQSETFHQKLKQEITDANFANQEKYEQLEKAISEMENKFKERNGNLSEEISDLKNVTTKTASKDCKERLIREVVSDLKHHTDNDIWRIKENIKEILMEVSNITEANIEKKARKAYDGMQEDLMSLRNFTVMELTKQEETDLKLEQKYSLLQQYLKSKLVSKTDFTLKLSALQNRTEADKMDWEDRLSQLKIFTTREIRTVVEKTEKEGNMIYEKISNKSNECKMSTAELWSNLTDVKKDLSDITSVIEKEKNLTVNHIDDEMARFAKVINSLINYIDTNYENITNTIKTELAEKSQCVCPTARPLKPTVRITQSPTVTTLPSNVTQSPTETVTSLPITLPLTSEKTVTITPVETDWPEGAYAFMTPVSGCPESEGFSWEEGWIQFHTESDYNNDKASKEYHLKGPLFRTDGIDNFIQIHYCLKKETVTNARAWPKGTYCINRVNGQCPSGFRSGYIQYDEEHTHVQQRHKNAPDIKSVKGSLERVYYCCRRDGSTEVAVNLPTIKPFYLYRAKDVPCQKVSGMKVSVEILQIDTNHEDNQDEIEDPDNHPYAFLHPVKHSLCYYSL